MPRGDPVNREELLEALRCERYGPITREHHNTFTDDTDVVGELIDELGDEEEA